MATLTWNLLLLIYSHPYPLWAAKKLCRQTRHNNLLHPYQCKNKTRTLLPVSSCNQPLFQLNNSRRRKFNCSSKWCNSRWPCWISSKQWLLKWIKINLNPVLCLNKTNNSTRRMSLTITRRLLKQNILSLANISPARWHLNEKQARIKWANWINNRRPVAEATSLTVWKITSRWKPKFSNRRWVD